LIELAAINCFPSRQGIGSSHSSARSLTGLKLNFP
jgi:hypothetical protein